MQNQTRESKVNRIQLTLKCYSKTLVHNESLAILSDDLTQIQQLSYYLLKQQMMSYPWQTLNFHPLLMKRIQLPSFRCF
ncbi:hypothetical protein FGO68_gene2857 [Halteria grandinella]|uniref:Uncharacterized protein n=1 Tax=Halteria grandinella TaxID=5974 RepID=A0A8J8NKU7_HALGN|nr:hypothetical protein FGO68_gene2857 [Halteria grandinella]